MEISSIISNLQTATVKTNGIYTHQTTQHQKTNEATKEVNKNQEINDKADISNEALQLLKNEYGTKTNSKQGINNTGIYNNVSKNNTKNGYLYKKAAKGYAVTANKKTY